LSTAHGGGKFEIRALPRRQAAAPLSPEKNNGLVSTEQVFR